MTQESPGKAREDRVGAHEFQGHPITGRTMKADFVSRSLDAAQAKTPKYTAR